MSKKNSFDDNLKTNLNISNYYMKPSQNIFEVAWIKKDEQIKRNLSFTINYRIKAVIISICIMMFGSSILLLLSPNCRTFAMNSIKSIFIVEKINNDYKVVEKPENKPLEYENIGGIYVDESNRNLIEKRLGFSFYIPEKIGQNITRSTMSQIGMTAYKIKVEDIPVLSNKLIKSIEDDSAFKELTNNDIKLYITGIYSDSMNNTYYLHISKDRNDLSKTVILEETIENIKCNVLEAKVGLYPEIRGENSISDDYSKKPVGIKKFMYVAWNYNGINYKVTSPDETLKLDNLNNFVREYIKNLKNH